MLSIRIVVIVAIMSIALNCFAQQQKQVILSPLMKASKEGNIKAVKAILSEGANVNKSAENGYTALIYAAFHGYSNIVRLLIENEADKNIIAPNGVTPVSAAAISKAKGSTEVLKLLFNGIDINARDKDGDSLLMIAIVGGNFANIKLLINFGADVNIINEKGWTPVWKALFGRHERALRILLENGAKIKDEGRAMGMASFWASKEIIRILLDYGIDINIREADGGTALMTLVQSKNANYIDAFKFVLSKNADVNIKNNDGDTALMFAIKAINIEAVELLLEKGADINLRNNKGNTALMGTVRLWGSSRMSMKAIIGLLIEEGVNIDAIDNNGDTALIIASKGNAVTAVEMLMKAGADVTKMNNEGETALTVAKKYKIKELLKDAMPEKKAE